MKEVSNFYYCIVKLENMIYEYSESSEMRLVVYYIISYISSFLFKKMLDVLGGLKSF